MKKPTLLFSVLLAGCGQSSDDGGPGGAGADSGASSDAAAETGTMATCTPCTETTECGSEAACVQYAGGDYCGRLCGPNPCGSDETCLEAVREDGVGVSVCVPADGTCGDSGCGVCPANTTCDPIGGECAEPEPDGGTDEPDGGTDEPDGGTDPGSVGPDGGKLPRLFFAVVGDTRPPGSDATQHYPTGTITQIYKDFEALTPRPAFVIATGDYVFANPHGKEGAKQLALYVKARKHYSGTVFASLGNHECGGNNGNCAGATNNSYDAFLDKLVKPLGKSKPYYSVPIDDVDGKWTAKILITACNAWSTTQKSWLETQLAKKTTFTIIARHQPMGSDAPCNAQMDKILAGAKYDLLLVGHRHFWEWTGSKRQLIEGLGGAPVTKAGQQHGFATIRQLSDGHFRVRQYKAGSIKQPLKTFTVP